MYSAAICAIRTVKRDFQFLQAQKAMPFLCLMLDSQEMRSNPFPDVFFEGPYEVSSLQVSKYASYFLA